MVASDEVPVREIADWVARNAIGDRSFLKDRIELRARFEDAL
jgi:hypothetical protein